jgi:hypothetical protein
VTTTFASTNSPELSSDNEGFKAPIIVFCCEQCWYLGVKQTPVCPSCSSICSLKIAAPAMSDLYFKKVRRQRPFDSSSFRSSGESEDDDSPPEILDPDEAHEESEAFASRRQSSREDEVEDEDEDEDEAPAEAADVAPVASFQGGGIVRISSSDAGVDHVFSGGIPKNHAFMLAASPGGGKSTLCRQLAAGMAQLGHKIMIAAGEEVGDVANDEFKRLELYKRFPKGSKKVLFSGSSDTDAVIAAAHQNKVDVLFVDSLSILSSNRVQGPPGKEKQVNYAAYHLMQAAHASNEYEGQRPFTVVMISHVTKDGSMAGPNTAKHWTDGAFILEHIDPNNLEPVDDQNRPTGFVHLRVLGKYRRGSSMNRTYYRFTDTGLHPWKPGDADEQKKDLRAPKTRSAIKSQAKAKTKRTVKSRPKAAGKRGEKIKGRSSTRAPSARKTRARP